MGTQPVRRRQVACQVLFVVLLLAAASFCCSSPAPRAPSTEHAQLAAPQAPIRVPGVKWHGLQLVRLTWTVSGGDHAALWRAWNDRWLVTGSVDCVISGTLPMELKRALVLFESWSARLGPSAQTWPSAGHAAPGWPIDD